MIRIVALFLSCISTVVLAESVLHKGIEYQVERDLTELSCSNFSFSLESRSFPFNLRESKIPYEITLGHIGKPHLISQSFTYSSPGQVSEPEQTTALLPNYIRIDNKRKYLAAVGACAGVDSVTVSFWGGGNCRNVCEAWALITFSKQGKVQSSKGLTYAEFKKYN
jgi:hypothetical protein